MSQAQFTIPLITVIPGQLITASLWNNEFNNIGTNLNPQGVGGYSDTDTQMQIQTAPYPGNVTSHSANLAGEIERLRYQINQIMGQSFAYWYQGPPKDYLTGTIGVTLSSLGAWVIPVGGIVDWAMPSIPLGLASYWFLCNGQALSRTQYAPLFSIMGTTFGIGDGSTTFNLPNYNDRFPVGAGNLYGLGSTGGAATHTLVDAEIPSTTPVSVSITDPGHTHIATDSGHSHGVTDPGHTHTEIGEFATGSASNVMAKTNTGSASPANSGNSTASSTTGLTVNSGTANVTNTSHTTGITATGTLGGGNGAHSILNPYIAMYKIMRCQ